MTKLGPVTDYVKNFYNPEPRHEPDAYFVECECGAGFGILDVGVKREGDNVVCPECGRRVKCIQ